MAFFGHTCNTHCKPALWMQYSPLNTSVATVSCWQENKLHYTTFGISAKWSIASKIKKWLLGTCRSVPGTAACKPIIYTFLQDPINYYKFAAKSHIASLLAKWTEWKFQNFPSWMLWKSIVTIGMVCIALLHVRERVHNKLIKWKHLLRTVIITDRATESFSWTSGLHWYRASTSSTGAFAWDWLTCICGTPHPEEGH